MNVNPKIKKLFSNRFTNSALTVVLSFSILLIMSYLYPFFYVYVIGGGLHLLITYYQLKKLYTYYNHEKKIFEEQILYEKKIKEHMVEDLCHDIKAPLSTLRGQMEAILDGIMPADQKTLELSIQQIDRVTKLVDELDLSLDALHLTGKLKSYKLSKFLNHITANFELVCNSRGMRYEVINDLNNDYELLIDSNRLYQAFFNIFNNSIRFSNKSNSVFRIVIKEAEHHIDIFLADNGTGIALEDEPYIFERLYKGDASRKKEKDSGSGLGLFITKEIVEYHGGQISIFKPKLFESGCTLLIKLPKPKVWVA
ncbi:sensor histidine kinase [Desulfuribacillus alkaliarsenatis]|uniref:histidine kinase n=1 Tax=Desulfuribacillus alkaliarsenatis TaxID=766136 RepID=A0A1E5G4L9_9FIRM|nr:HAMP domain-containing sensor histidine kinase [Desulfuribacillus alkaliarsenatis]OEF98121.1 hypothetical protein BHF68_00055 [Desulfuribacillus alkaliarsenatis]